MKGQVLLSLLPALFTTAAPGSRASLVRLDRTIPPAFLTAFRFESSPVRRFGGSAPDLRGLYALVLGILLRSGASDRATSSLNRRTARQQQQQPHAHARERKPCPAPLGPRSNYPAKCAHGENLNSSRERLDSALGQIDPHHPVLPPSALRQPIV